MMSKFLFSFMLFASSILAQVPDDEANLSSISGVVRDSQRTPLADVTVGIARRQVQTGTDGRYRLEKIEAGRHSIYAYREAAQASRAIRLGTGQALTGVDITLDPLAEITGRVVDEQGEPKVGVEVVLVGSELYLGTLRHTDRASEMTDDQGNYRLPRIVPGAPWAVAVKPFVTNPPAISDESADPRARRPTASTTYYPNSPSPEGAVPITLRPGEVRQGVDIRMMSSPNFCVEGQADLGGEPQELYFQIEELAAISGRHSMGTHASLRPWGRTTTDGKFRMCALAPGDYRLTVRTDGDEAPFFFGVANVAVTDRDVKNVTVSALPQVPLTGEVAWHSAPPYSGGGRASASPSRSPLSDRFQRRAGHVSNLSYLNRSRPL